MNLARPWHDDPRQEESPRGRNSPLCLSLKLVQIVQQIHLKILSIENHEKIISIINQLIKNVLFVLVYDIIIKNRQ